MFDHHRINRIYILLNKLLIIIALGIISNVIAQSHQPSLCYDELRLIHNIPILKTNKYQIEVQHQKNIDNLNELGNIFIRAIDRLHSGCHPKVINEEKEKKFDILFKKFKHQVDSLQKDYFNFEKLQYLKINNIIQNRLTDYLTMKQILRPFKKTYLECHESCNDITDQLIAYFNDKK